MAAFAVVVCATAVCTRETSVRVGARAPAAGEVRARRWRRKPVHAEPARFLARKALARNRVPATMPSQWPACWLVLGASRVQLATRKPVEEAAQIPCRVRKPVEEAAQIPCRVRKPVEEVAQAPRRMREMVGEAAQAPRRVRKPAVEVAQIPRRVGEQVPEVTRSQSRVRELALALEAQDPRRRQVLRRAPELSPVRKFVPAPRAA